MVKPKEDADTSESKIVKKVKKRVRKAPPIVVNLLNTRYDVLSEQAELLNWRVSESEEEENFTWDVFWSDMGVGSEKLSKMKNY